MCISVIRICQLGYGNMLSYENEDETFKLEQVGYPYSELPQSNIEMVRILYAMLGIELSETDAISTYSTLVKSITPERDNYTAHTIVMCLTYSNDTRLYCQDRIESNKRNMKTRIGKISENDFLVNSKVVENVMVSMGLDLKNCKAKVYVLSGSENLNVLSFSKCDFPILSKYINISEACYNTSDGILIVNAEDFNELVSVKKFCRSSNVDDKITQSFERELGFSFKDFLLLLSLADNEESRFFLRRVVCADDLDTIDLKKIISGAISNLRKSAFDLLGQWFDACLIGDKRKRVLCNDIDKNENSPLLEDIAIISMLIASIKGVSPKPCSDETVQRLVNYADKLLEAE